MPRDSKVNNREMYCCTGHPTGTIRYERVYGAEGCAYTPERSSGYDHLQSLEGSRS